MSESTFFFEVLTPERCFFSGEIEALTFTASDGEWTILKGHAPMIAVLRAGTVKMKIDGQWKEAINSEGYMEIAQSGVILFAQTCEWPEEVDINEAQREKMMAEEALRQSRSQNEYRTSQIMMARAMAKLRKGGKKVNLD